MLKAAFEEVLPYISNIDKLREFVEENEDMSEDEALSLLHKMVDRSEGTLKTDFRILLNEFEKTINKR